MPSAASIVAFAAAISAVAAAPNAKRAACKQTYTSVDHDTCIKIDAKFNLVEGTTQAANDFVNCQDIWAWTPLCIPDGPYKQEVACAQTYTSKSGDNCEIIENQFNLASGAISTANAFLNCNDIWAYTPICVPSGPLKNGAATPSGSSSAAPSTPTPTCKQTYSAKAGDNCASIDKAFKLVSGTVAAANSFLNCNDVWAWTPVCIPDGPYKQEEECQTEYCVEQTYYTSQGENCGSIEGKLGLDSGEITAENPFVNCGDIWAGTALKVCVPVAENSSCKNTIAAWNGATCDNVAAAFGVIPAQIKAWNTFVDCNGIWENTPLCVAH